MHVTGKGSKSKPEVEFQYGGRLFSKPKALVSQLWILVEKLQCKNSCFIA